MSGSTVFYEFNVSPDSSSFDQSPTVSVENNVAYWVQTLVMVIGKMDASKRNLVKTLAIGNFIIIVLDKNGTYWLGGKSGNQDTGMYANGGSLSTGKAGTDLSGASLEMIANVLYPAPEVDPTIVAGLL